MMHPDLHAWVESIYKNHDSPSSILTVWKHACVALLDLDKQPTLHSDPRLTVESLLVIGDQLAIRVQDDMDKAALPFHNSLHVCDALISASYVNAAWFKKSCAGDSDVPAWRLLDAAVLLFAVLVHDWGHDGGPVDREPPLEVLSVQRVMNALSFDLGCSPTLVARVQELIAPLILATDPRYVRELHQRWAISKSQDLWLQVLITECDVAASLIPDLGPNLTRFLLLEKSNWNQVMPQSHALNCDKVLESWMLFVQSAQVSSSCAEALGWRKLCLSV